MLERGDPVGAGRGDLPAGPCCSSPSCWVAHNPASARSCSSAAPWPSPWGSASRSWCCCGGSWWRTPGSASISPWIDLGVGLLLILFAVVVSLRSPRGPKKSRQRHELGLLSLFTIGLVMYSPSPLYLASLHAIAKGHTGATAHGVEHRPGRRDLHVDGRDPGRRTRRPARGDPPDGHGRSMIWLSPAPGRALICVAAAVFGTYLVISAVVHLV